MGFRKSSKFANGDIHVKTKKVVMISVNFNSDRLLEKVTFFVFFREITTSVAKLPFVEQLSPYCS